MTLPPTNSWEQFSKIKIENASCLNHWWTKEPWRLLAGGRGLLMKTTIRAAAVSPPNSHQLPQNSQRFVIEHHRLWWSPSGRSSNSCWGTLSWRVQELIDSFRKRLFRQQLKEERVVPKWSRYFTQIHLSDAVFHFRTEIKDYFYW